MTLPKILAHVLAAVVALGGIVFVALIVMILWPDPKFAPMPPPTPEQIQAFQASFEQPYRSEARHFVMRDGDTLAAQRFAASSQSTIVLVHGVLANSFLHNRDSGRLRAATGAEVIAIDLRGHGASQGAPGDTRYIGQYEDDLADVISAVRARRPGGRVFLAGHSMGGGIALRYAIKPGSPKVDGCLLLAPNLGWSSPTTPKEARASGPEFLKLHVARTLGLVAMNEVGITAFNGLRTMFFNLPEGMPLRSYSYRAMAGMAPDDYRLALRAVRVPLLVVVGSADEAFVADRYPQVVRSNSGGRVVIVPGASHDGVVSHDRTLAAVASWVHGIPPPPTR